MAIKRIRLWGDPVLKTRAKPVAAVTSEVRNLVTDLFETNEAEQGVGLAANQIGSLQRVCIISVPGEDGRPAQKVALINPELTYQSKTKDRQEEGCLSFPGIWGPVERPLDVEIRALDLNNQPVVVRGTGLLARALQHELDHLNGIVFIERMSLVHRTLLNKKLRELAARGRRPAGASTSGA